MKKYFFMQPRMSGKTSIAKYEFFKNPKNSIYIGLSDMLNSDAFGEFFKNKPNNIFSQYVTSDSFRSKKINTVIIDEYLKFDKENVGKIYNLVNSCPDIENIYIYSTSKIQYNSKIIDFIRENKATMMFMDMKKVLETLCPLNDLSYVDDLFRNFLTDDDCKIISNNKTFVSHDRYIHDTSGLRYKLEVLNQWKIDDKDELKIKEEYKFSQYSSLINTIGYAESILGHNIFNQ